MVIGLSGVQFGLYILRVITKSDDPAAGDRFVNHECSPELDDTKTYHQLISEERIAKN